MKKPKPNIYPLSEQHLKDISKLEAVTDELRIAKTTIVILVEMVKELQSRNHKEDSELKKTVDHVLDSLKKEGKI
jgi:hypothetical protein